MDLVSLVHWTEALGQTTDFNSSRRPGDDYDGHPFAIMAWAGSIPRLALCQLQALIELRSIRSAQ
jgi:hypothetical protein